ncbi:MAG: TonB-dependent receptor plug domain-containing protein [Luteitalea sp.]|nr:TonB-dependent receptor plug domain-containing protein [Luteitalea sp.]
MYTPFSGRVRCRGRLVGCAVVTVALVGVALTPVHAQVLYGSIVGNVTDASGAVVPGATVTITHQERTLTREEVTDHTGRYSFPTVPTGTYSVQVALTGFQTFERDNVRVTLNSVARVNATLGVGTVAETVMVAADTPLLQTDRAEVRAEITRKELVDLPGSLARNYQYLLNTLPGVAPFEIREANPSNATGSSIFNVSGASQMINNTRIDGASTTNIWQPQYAAYNPALEAISSVNVVTNSYDAEQGLAGGAAINVELRSGTNEFHGSLFEYHHNQHLRARGFFLPPDVQLGKFVMNQYGGTLGGPIKRGRVFFFASFEGYPDRQNADRIASVPSAAVRSGDMSGYPTIYDPLTGNPDGSGRVPFPNNRIPEHRKDPIAQKIVDLIPAPNLPGETRNYFASAATKTDRTSVDTKVNWNVSNRLTMFSRFSVLDMDYLNGTTFGEQLGGAQIRSPGNPGKGNSRVYSFSTGATYIVSPNFIIDGNIGIVAHNTGVEQPRLDENVGLDFLGIPGTNGPQRYQGGWPSFRLSGYDAYGEVNAYMPYWRWDDQAQYVANFNLTKGTHEIRWGLDLYYQAMNHTQPELGSNGARGNFVFGTGPTRLRQDGMLSPDSPAHSFASFLLGLPTQVGKNVMTIDPFTTRQWAHTFYVRDRWQVTPKLTLSMGTRWEYYPIPTREDRGFERYDPVTNQIMIGGLGDVPEDMGVQVSKKGFAPRLGVAYRATNTLVVRAGYGLSIDPYSMARALRTNYPVIIDFTLPGSNSWTPVGPLANGIPEVPVPDLGNGIIDIPPGLTARALPDKHDRGYLQSWNFTIEKELPNHFTVEAGYVANRQIRQLGFRELNWAPIGGGEAGRQLVQAFGRTASTQLISPIGDSHYDSLQARLQRRFADGFSLQIAYTWSKSITTSGADDHSGSLAINIPEYYHLNRRVSNFDRTHNLQITNISELPFGRGKRFLNDGGWVSALLGGWQLNSTLSFYTGTPFSVTAGGASLNAPGNSQRADQVKPTVQKLGGIGPGQAYFDPLAFAPVNEARFGTAGFNTLRGPGVANWDFGVFRNFSIKEGWNLQFRMDSFNVTNTPHFNNPGANVNNLLLNPDGTVSDLNGFSEVLSAWGERQFRFGLRLSF